MLVAVTLMLFIFAMVVPFLRTQTREVGRNAGNLNALQNARFSQNAIDRELRVAGAGVVPQRMFIVQAAPMAITFNADLVSADSNDANGVYYDPNVDTSTTHELPAASAITLPLSAQLYPGQDYVSAPGVLSTAQTISYWLTLDSTAALPNIYTIHRRVNNAAATTIATGISVPTGKPFFQYYKINGATGTLDSIPNASLPLIHTVAAHSTPADSGVSALTDSIRAVRMTVTGMYNDPTKGPIYRTVTTMTKLLNAGLLYAAACGSPPIAVTTPTATWFGGATTDSVTLTFAASVDQNGGEKDIEYYMIYERPVGSLDWGNPVTTLAAGTATYHWSDPVAPNLHGSWQYNVIAQDCTPANSGNAVSNTVTLP